MLSGVFWMVANNDRVGFTKSTGEYHYGKLFGLADSAGVFLNQLLNSEFSSVTKDLNGHNLPAHQMTSLGYRTKHLIAAIKRDIDNVKRSNFFKIFFNNRTLSSNVCFNFFVQRNNSQRLKQHRSLHPWFSY